VKPWVFPQFVAWSIKTRAEIKLQQQLGGAIGIFCIAIAIGIDFGISGPARHAIFK